MRQRRVLFFIAALLLLLLSSCRLWPRQVSRSFYYWRSAFSLSAADKELLKRLRIERLYVRCFDVVWDAARGEPVPVSALRFKTKFPRDIDFIPTVFITNETMSKTPREALPALADHILSGIDGLAATGSVDYGEIQMDCDWTQGTKDQYFSLLSLLRQRLARETLLSATIRLHQVRYRADTGVPPVARGMLMYYNLRSPGDFQVENSIQDFKAGRAYLADVRSYPMPLDVALSLFSWGVVFQGESCMGLIGNLTRADLEANPAFVQVAANRFLAKANTNVQGAYVYKNDLVRLEESSSEENRRIASFLAKRLRNRHLSLALFHFDPKLLEGIGHEEMAGIYRSLH